MDRSIYTGCELVKLQPNTKKVMAGSPPATVDHPGNAAARNGTGGLIVVDIDGKNGGSLDLLFRAVPEFQHARTTTVTTASPNSYHLVYRIPERLKPRTGFSIVGNGVEVPPFYVLPGSTVAGVPYRSGDQPVADAPAQLLELLEPGTITEAEYNEETGGTGGAEHLLQKLTDAPPGQRNAAFLEVAFPVLGILGPDAGAAALELAWPGEESEIQHKVASALRGLDSEHTSTRRVSRARARRTSAALDRALFGAFRGKPGTVQRRVLHAIATRCHRDNELSVYYATGSIAVDTGTYPHRVTDALKALEEQGLVVSHNGYRTLVMTDDPGEYPEPPGYSELLSPNHPVWLSEHLSGRHSQVFAYHLAGVDSATRVARGSGISRQTVTGCRAELEAAGVLDATADWESLTLSGAQRRERVRENVSESLERLERLEQEREQPTETGSDPWEPPDPHSRRALEEQALSESL